MTLEEARNSGKPYKQKSNEIWLIWKDNKDWICDRGIATYIHLTKKSQKATDWEIIE